MSNLFDLVYETINRQLVLLSSYVYVTMMSQMFLFKDKLQEAYFSWSMKEQIGVQFFSHIVELIK